MPGDEFEIVPKKEIEGLKKDVDGIKSDPLGSSPSGKNLTGSIDKLTKSMDGMFELFKVANKEIKEEASSLEFMKQLAPLFENLNKKMEKILEQHDKIADGIVAIADLVKQMKEENDKKAKKEIAASRPRPAPPAPAPPAPIVPAELSPEVTTQGIPPPPSVGGPAPMSGGQSIIPPG